MKTIHLAPALTFPAAELATEVVASLGQRGGGKSNGAAVIAEGLLAAGIQVIVLDHVGIWFSLRLDASGKHPSPYQIPVLGGQHGDIALVSSTGAVVAEALAQSGSSAVLDVSSFGKMERCRFAADFAEAFFNAKKLHPGPVQILLEEAQRYVPQKLFSGQGLERMLGAFEEIAEVGRNYGIGLHLISQRPQKINKDVLNLADTVLAYRSNGVLERKAIGEWVQEKGAEGRKEVHDELPGLPRGSAIVWSPNRDTYGQFAIKLKSTYDAGATPLHARAAVKTKRLDLDSLESAMGRAVEESKANDPRVLKAKIAELEKKLAGAADNGGRRTGADSNSKTGEAATDKAIRAVRSALLHVERLAVKLEKREDKLLHDFNNGVGAYKIFVDVFEKNRDRLAQAQQAVVSELGNLKAVIGAVSTNGPPTGAAQSRTITGAATTSRANGVRGNVPGRREHDGTSFVDPGRGERQAHVTGAAATHSDGQLSRAARAILGVLAQRNVANDSQISALSGYRKTSSSFANALSELRTQGYIEGTPGRRHILPRGAEAAGPTEPLPAGAALLGYWKSRLSRAEAAMLDAVYAAKTISREGLSQRTGYSITSSSFANAMSGLRVLDLVTGPPGGDLSIAEVFG